MASLAPRSRPGRAAPPPVRLMIVDDSVVARTVLARLIEVRREFEIVALARSAEDALATLRRTSVDVILLDLNMPGVDGLTALPDILRQSDGARVLIVSASAEEGAAATIKALTLGAADTLHKPTAGSFNGPFADALLERLARIGAPPRPQPTEWAAPPPPARLLRTDPIGCVAIGASTGGLVALTEFFRALPPAFDVPLLVTQHLPATFMPYFAAQIADIAKRPTSVARDGDRLTAGAVLVAPGDAHLRVVRLRGIAHATLDRRPAPSGCQPSVDPMLESVAEAFGAAGVGVVLSGMGRDGAIGAVALSGARGEVLAQDAGSSTIWGMPGAVAATGAASAVLPPAAIARRLATRAGDRRWR